MFCLIPCSAFLRTDGVRADARARAGGPLCAILTHSFRRAAADGDCSLYHHRAGHAVSNNKSGSGSVIHVTFVDAGPTNPAPRPPASPAPSVTRTNLPVATSPPRRRRAFTYAPAVCRRPPSDRTRTRRRAAGIRIAGGSAPDARTPGQAKELADAVRRGVSRHRDGTPRHPRRHPRPPDGTLGTPDGTLLREGAGLDPKRRPAVLRVRARIDDGPIEAPRGNRRGIRRGTAHALAVRRDRVHPGLAAEPAGARLRSVLYPRVARDHSARAHSCVHQRCAERFGPVGSGRSGPPDTGARP